MTEEEDLLAFASVLRTRMPQAEAPANLAPRIIAAVARHERRRRLVRAFAWSLPLAAVLTLAVGVLWLDDAPSAASPAGVAGEYRNAFAVSSKSADELAGNIEYIVKSQREDGSWMHPRLSACNVAALELAHRKGLASAESLRAYKRGLRWMRINGIRELTPAQFQADALQSRNWGA
ncbi:MAG: hypothetical protein IJ802_01800 [Kiritimatiellae bacterium]|nr:hypothetical protein [Kiritimatiellia bacterium]